jgi:hypothetical protein
MWKIARHPAIFGGGNRNGGKDWRLMCGGGEPLLLTD